MEITKSDLTTGKELPGAKLQVIDESGKIVDEWVSEKEPHVIKELAVGKTYTLVETKPADGYQQDRYHRKEGAARSQADDFGQRWQRGGNLGIYG